MVAADGVWQVSKPQPRKTRAWDATAAGPGAVRQDSAAESPTGAADIRQANRTTATTYRMIRLLWRMCRVKPPSPAPPRRHARDSAVCAVHAVRPEQQP